MEGLTLKITSLVMSASQNVENYCSIPSRPKSVLKNLPLHLEVLDVSVLNFGKSLCLSDF